MITAYIDFRTIYFTRQRSVVEVPLFLQPQLTVVPPVAALSVGRESLDGGCAPHVDVVTGGQPRVLRRETDRDDRITEARIISSTLHPPEKWLHCLEGTYLGIRVTSGGCRATCEKPCAHVTYLRAM